MTLRDRLVEAIVQTITADVAYWRFADTDDEGVELNRHRLNVDGDINVEAIASAVLGLVSEDVLGHLTYDEEGLSEYFKQLLAGDPNPGTILELRWRSSSPPPADEGYAERIEGRSPGWFREVLRWARLRRTS